VHIPKPISSALRELREGFVPFKGRLSPAKLAIVEVALAKESPTLVMNELLMNVTAKYPENTLKPNDMIGFFSASFISAAIDPAAATSLQLKLFPRFVMNPVWDLNTAHAFVARLITTFINPELANTLTRSLTDLDATSFALIGHLGINRNDIIAAMHQQVFNPILRLTSSPDNTLHAQLDVKLTEFFEPHRFQSMALQLQILIINSRNSQGAPTGGAGGGAGSPHPAPARAAVLPDRTCPGKISPPAAQPPGPSPYSPVPPNEVCHAFHALGGHCCYGAICKNARGHIPPIGPPATLALYNAWLPKWLAYTRYAQYRRWSDNNSADALWPRLCG